MGGITSIERLQPVNRGDNFQISVSSTSHRPINISPPSWSILGPRPILDDSEEDSKNFDDDEDDFDDDVGDLYHHLPSLTSNTRQQGERGPHYSVQKTKPTMCMYMLIIC